MTHFYSLAVNQARDRCRGPGVTNADLALVERDLHAPHVAAAFCLDQPAREAVPRSASPGVSVCLTCPKYHHPLVADERA
jgi:hypothetical protein